MRRSLSAAALAAALSVAVLPALPAYASAAAAATLTGGQQVYPGARTFTIRVTNNEQMLLGKTINAIRVNLPTESGVAIGSGPGTATGFTGTATNLGQTQFLTYRGGSLRPGSSVDIAFPAAVGAPMAKDLTGRFVVQVSSDNFATAKPATGAVSTAIKVLELVQESIKPLQPTNDGNTKGVTDRSGTAGQSIIYSSGVRNHSRSPLTVTTGLISAGGDSATSVDTPVPAGEAVTTQIPVTLGSAAADRTTAFTATAVSDGAVAPTKTDAFTVQAPATLVFSDLQPTRTRSGDGADRDFSALATKAGTPSLDVSASSLVFGDNVAATSQSPTFPAGASTQRITYSALDIVGDDGDLPAAVGTSASDNNLAAYTYDTALGTVLIDNLGPLLTTVVGLPKDADGDQQVAARSGNAITVSGTIARAAADLAASTLKVVLDPDQGPDVVVPVTLAGSGENRTYSGTATPTFDPAATSFTAKAEVADTADNIGSAQTATPTVIDGLAPLLDPMSGVVLTPNTIEVSFNDATGVAGGCTANAWSIAGAPGSVTEVRTADGTPCTTLGTGGRVLVLRNALGVDATPRVTYEAPGNRSLSARPVKDGAGNDAARQTINTISKLVPLAPGLTSLERKDGAAYEAAYLDTVEQAYYTNAAGADALRLTVDGIRKGYTVQVLKGGAPVVNQIFTADPAPLATSYSGSLLVPVTAGDGANDFAVRFISAGGNKGPVTPFKVVLDTLAPALGAATISGPAEDATVTVPFTEAVVRGSDFSGDWFVSETVDTEEGPAERTTNANSVTSRDSSTRALQATLLDPARFTGVDYYLNTPNALRYEDRAGNMLADTLTPSTPTG